MTAAEAIQTLRRNVLGNHDSTDAVSVLAHELERLTAYCESQDWHTEWYVPLKAQRDAAVAERDRSEHQALARLEDAVTVLLAAYHYYPKNTPMSESMRDALGHLGMIESRAQT